MKKFIIPAIIGAGWLAMNSCAQGEDQPRGYTESGYEAKMIVDQIAEKYPRYDLAGDLKGKMRQKYTPEDGCERPIWDVGPIPEILERDRKGR